MTDIIRDMICYFNGNKPSADNLLQHYVEGPNDIYDPDEVFEIAEEGCISFGEARVLQTILDDGYLSPDDAKMLKTLNYSDDRIMEIGRRFRMDVLNDGSCKAAVHHRAAWIVHNMSDSDNSYSLQRSYLYELEQSAPYNAPCVFEGKVNDWFTDSIFEMFDVRSPVVRDAAARAITSFWMASSGVDAAEIVSDMVDSQYLVEIIENAVAELGQQPAIHLFDRIIAKAKEEEFSEQQMISLYKWMGEALGRVEKIGPNWIGFIGKHIDDTKDGTAARLAFKHAISRHKAEILKLTNKLESFTKVQEAAVIRVCEEVGVEALPSLANILKKSFQLEVRQLSERALAKMGFYPGGPHTRYESTGLLLSILKKPAALLAFVDAIDILGIDPTDYCGIISSICDGSEMMNDILALCNGTLKKYRMNHRSVEK